MDEPVVRTIEDIWPLQAALNAKVGIDTLALGRRLAEEESRGALPAEGGAIPAGGGIRLEVGRALKNYIDALSSECHELMGCLAWKHWYKEARAGRQHELRDLQNARVEAVDLLFFWVSICQLLGLSPADVCRLYQKKLAINHRRRDEDRTQAQHGAHEDENRTVV
jgi:hypothetical protein